MRVIFYYKIKFFFEYFIADIYIFVYFVVIITIVIFISSKQLAISYRRITLKGGEWVKTNFLCRRHVR